MNLSKWNSFLFENNTTVKDTTARPNDGTIIVPSGLSPDGAVLKEMGYEVGKELGAGKYGTVVKIIDQETRNQFACKIIMGSPLPDIQREVSNYKFLINNRDKIGIQKKYFPKVYYSEIKQYTSAPNDFSSNPPVYNIGLIIMELLAPLPNRVKTDLLATGGVETGPRGRFDRRRVDFTKRDKRLFKNHTVIFDLAKSAVQGSQLLQNLTPNNFNQIVDDVARSAVNRFLKGDYQDIDGEAYEALQFIVSEDWRKMLNSRQSQVLFLLTLAELHSHLYPKDGEPVVAFMNDTLVGNIYNQVFESYLRAYVRPVIPGTMDSGGSTRIMEPQDSSSLEQFPEAGAFVRFMQEMKQIGIIGRDMHAGNFLMRPSDNEIVVVDLGLFKIQDIVQIPDNKETIPIYERKK
jgi:serine/threonine protein kinase